MTTNKKKEKDPRPTKKKTTTRRLSRLQRSSNKIIRSPNIITLSQQRVIGIKTRGKYLSYSHLYAMVVYHTLTHYSVKTGIKQFCGASANTVSDEIQQLHMKDIFTPVDKKALSRE